MSKEANLFILVDGLGWEWIKSLPFLRKEAPYRRPIETVLGFSTSAIPSILTGLPPQQHGRLTLFHLARNKSPFKFLRWLSVIPPEMVENRYVRFAIKHLARKIGGFTGYFQLYGIPLRYLPLLDVSEKSNIYRPGGIPEAESIFDLLEKNGVDYVAYSYHQGRDLALVKAMGEELSRGRKSFYFLYLAEVDAYLHLNANSPSRVEAVLARYAQALSYLYNTAREKYVSVKLYIFADHGMAPTRETYDIQSLLSRLNVKCPRDYLCLLDSTMARFWFFSDRARTDIMSLLDGGKGRWIDEAELRDLGAYFPDNRYGDAIYLMPEGTVIAPSHMGETAPPGMHGFHPRSPHSYAAFLSSEDCCDNVSCVTDIFHLMRRAYSREG